MSSGCSLNTNSVHGSTSTAITTAASMYASRHPNVSMSRVNTGESTAPPMPENDMAQPSASPLCFLNQLSMRMGAGTTKMKLPARPNTTPDTHHCHGWVYSPMAATAATTKANDTDRSRFTLNFVIHLPTTGMANTVAMK